MEPTTLPEILTTIAGVSPFVGLLGWLFFQERTDRKSKEIELREMNNKVLEIFQQNIKTSEGLKSAVENNTTATRNLTQAVYQGLGGDGKKR